MLVISSFFLFNACNKEINFSSGSLDYRDTQNYGNSHILSNIQFDQQGNILLGNGNAQGTLQHANIEFQREVSNYIYYQSSKQKIDSINELYGTPLWEIATIDFWNQTTSNYIITVPFIKNNKLAGVLIYQSLENEKKAYLFDDISFEQTLEKTRENSTFFKEMIIPVTKYGIYQFLITNSIHPKYNIWINLAINNSQNTLNDRNFLRICFEIAYSTYEPDTYTETIHIEERCIWASLGFRFFTGFQWSNDYEVGGGNNNGVNNNNKNNKNKKLDCLVAIIDFMAREDVLDMIENNSLLDPCNPNMSTEQILEKFAYDACNKGGDINNLKNLDQLFSDIGEEQDIIIDSLTNAKIKCIVGLTNSIDDKLFCNSIQNFFMNSKINLTFKEDENIRGQAATGSYSNGNTYIKFNPIWFDDDFCEIQLVLIVLHEGIHAEINRQYYQNYTGDEIPKNELWDIWDYNSSDHQNIAKNYIPYMIESLKSIYGNRYTDIEYEAVAWMGLGNITGQGGNSTAAWEDLPETKKQQLQNAFEKVNSNCDADICK